MAPRSRIEDRGLEALGQFAKDPVGGFLLRILGPGVRREIKRVERRVNGFFEDVSGAFEDAEGHDLPKEPEIIDAEFEEERIPPKRK